MEIVRRILLKVESTDDGRGEEASVEFPDIPQNMLYGHLKLLDEAGLIEGLDSQTIGAHFYVPMRLTWEGHEFLSVIRDDGIWKKTLRKLAAVSGSTTMELVKAVAISVAKEKLGLSA